MTFRLCRSLFSDYCNLSNNMTRSQQSERFSHIGDFCRRKLSIGNQLIKSVILCLSVLLIVSTTLVDASQKSIYVDNNSYKDIVISFDPAIQINLVSTLIDNLEEKIQQVSNSLYTATNQSLCFGEVIVLIPDQWSGKIGNRRINTTRTFTALDTDIYINSNGASLNDEPYTDQYGQCGVGGKLIHLSQDIFLEKSTNFQSENTADDSPVTSSTHSTARVKSILHQWATYRYGVFSEHSYQNDKFSPDYTIDTNSDRLMTSCSSSVSTFCSEENHDAFSPTKQNRLCDGKSIIEVIRNHPDFRKTQPIAGNKCITKFTMVTTKRPRLAVFFDHLTGYDDVMILDPIRTLLDQYKPLIYQLKQFEAIPLESKAIVKGHPENVPVCFDCAMEQLRGNVKNVDDSITHLYIVTAGNFRMDRFTLESYAKELLSYDIKVKIVIYPYKSENNYTDLMRFAQAASAELNVVPHIDTKMPGSTYNQIAFLESLVLSRNNLNPTDLVVLSKATTTDTDKFTFKFDVDQSLIEANYSIQVILLCHSSDECGKRVEQSVYINDVQVKYGGRILLSAFTTYTFTAYPQRQQDGLWVVEWSGLNPNVVSYMVAIAVLPSTTLITPPKQSIAAPVLESNFIAGSCWLAPSESIISTTTSRDRIFAYVSLTKRLTEYVQNASVSIAFYDELGGLVSTAQMVDNGLGDPDVTRGDGTWSYLVSDVPSRRFIRAEAIVASGRFSLYPGIGDRPCCGSSVPEDKVITGYKFLNRVISCGSFYIDDIAPVESFVRVSRTFDLTVSLIEETRYIIKAEFIVPHGISSIEEIKIFNWTERSFIRSDFNSYGVRLGSAIELESSEFVREFEIPKGTIIVSGPYVVAMQLKDIHGSYQLSNLVNIYLNAATGSRGGFFSDGTNGVLGIWHVTAILVGSFLFILVSLLFIICLVAGRKRRGSGSGHHSGKGNVDSMDSKDNVKNKLPPSSMGTDNPDKSVYRSYSDELLGVKGGNTDLGSTNHFVTSQSSHQTLKHQQISHQQLNHHHQSQQQLTQQQQQQQQQTQQQLINNQLIYQNDSSKLMDESIKGISPIDSIPANKLLSHYDKVKQAKQRNEPLPVMRIEDIVDLGSIHNVSSVSDNDSRFRGSVTGLPDEPYVTMANDLNTWRYPTPVVDQYQYCYTPQTNYVPHTNNINNMPSGVIAWRNSYDGSETASDYDPRYGTVDKSTTAVSQV
ncbi:uncharacterized protein LOC128391035 isoform X2 [Panonychus citri]|uniref:uncharacterized protein LOC128391035 isoform X2 n=1 Tax=Panonychus citri TaxID=50023 RepID=UPI0023072811|nr:uncharacterized protein LOC128391035 isoform X2 [Panonychus citri]